MVGRGEGAQHLWYEPKLTGGSTSIGSQLSRLQETGKEYCKRRHFRAVHVFAHFHRATDERKFDVSDNYDHHRTNKINWYVRENASYGLMRKKFSSEKKIYVYSIFNER